MLVVISALNLERKDPGAEYHGQQKQQVLRSAPGVKNQRKNKQYHVLLLDIACKIIRDKIQRKKEKNKKQA